MKTKDKTDNRRRRRRIRRKSRIQSGIQSNPISLSNLDGEMSQIVTFEATHLDCVCSQAKIERNTAREVAFLRVRKDTKATQRKNKKKKKKVNVRKLKK
jgi:hypothetical protein